MSIASRLVPSFTERRRRGGRAQGLCRLLTTQGLAALFATHSLAAWRFVSIPDWLNEDVGSISGLPTWNGGQDSTSPSREAAITYVMDAIAAENPDFVLVAGDLVMGHWHADTDGRRIFGPATNLATKAAAIDAAADHYYPIWKQRFADRGLVFHAALGDHEIGDNNWPAGFDKSYLIPNFKAAFARHFTRDAGGAPRYALRPLGTPQQDTAYAFQHSNLLVVAVDVWHQQHPAVEIGPNGSVQAAVRDGQLAWLDSVLAAARNDPTIDHIIVQGHTPCLAPVRTQNSSGITMPGAHRTDFWRTLTNRAVDVYLAGEAHDVSASNYGGVEQVAHGGLLGKGSSINYLVGTVDGDTLHLVLKSIQLSHSGGLMWQSGPNRLPSQVSWASAGFQNAGELIIDKSQGRTVYTKRTGAFQWYGTVPEPPNGLLVHLRFDEGLGRSATNMGLTGYQNHGQLEGPSDFTPGKLGSGILLTGNTARVVCGPTPLGFGTPRTVSAWVWSTSTVHGTVLSMGTNGHGSKWDMDIDGPAAGVVEVGVGNGRTVGAGVAVNDGAWHLVTTVLPDGASTLAGVEVYVDGEFQYRDLTATRVINTSKEGQLILGHSANSSSVQVFTGKIDDVAIWSRALRPTEIRALHRLGHLLGANAGDVERMLLAAEDHASVTIAGQEFYFYPAGVPGAAGEVAALAEGQLTVHLDDGSAFSTVPFELRALSIDPSATTALSLQWNSLPQTRYVVETTTNAVDWFAVSPVVASEGLRTSALLGGLEVSADGRQYFRVRIVSPPVSP